MKIIKIKDNSQIFKQNFINFPQIIEKIADKTILQLEKEGVFVFPEIASDSQDLTAEQILLQSYNNCYKTSNIMGYIGYGDERVVIGSRFCNDNNDFFLNYLLYKVFEEPNITSFVTDTEFNDKIFNLLVFLFPFYLNNALRKGPYKTYIRNDYNDFNVKGSIDIKRHLKLNIPFFGKIAYNLREQSLDNYIMELIRQTIEYIKKKPYGNKILKNCKENVELVQAVTPGYKPQERQKIIYLNKQNPIFHAYYSEYRQLQHLCLLILEGFKHNIGEGSKQIYGVLFDGAYLWEEYINGLLKDEFYHPLNRAGKDAQYLFSGKNGRIFPDFISKDYINRTLADAKYKPSENIASKDYEQLLAYMYRFNAKRGIYFYPSNDSEQKIYKLNSGSTYEKDVQPTEIKVIKQGLEIANENENYQKFVEKMQKNEENFINSVKYCLNN